MASDVVLLEQTGDLILVQTERTAVQLAPIPIGRSYLISAKGNIFASNSRATVVLDAFGEKDTAEIGFSGNQGQASFSLVVGVSLPNDEDLFTVAKVTGTSKPFVGGPETGLAVLKGVKLVVLSVDSMAVTKVPS
jgi:hypothetical protein